MRTAEEMYDYCIENGYGRGLTRNWAIKHFKLLEENLRSDEEVYMTFIGLNNYISPTKHGNNYAYAITNQRIMFGQKKMFGGNFKSVVLDKFNDISSSTGMLMGVITIDTLGEVFNVGVNKETADNISNELHNIIFSMRNESDKRDFSRKNNSIEEIKKYKELLDSGIITEDEFNQKKKELLGL